VAIENAKAYTLLADLDRDKSRFLRMTTHELRSPVRVTESLLMTLAGGYVGTLDPDQTDVVRRAQRRLASLHALIDDLLDLAAGKSDMVTVKRRVLDLRTVVAEVAERFQTVSNEKGIGLTFASPSDEVPIWFDPADAERLLVNLVSNAVKYTKQGGVTVTLAKEGGHARLDVADTGIGIPPDALPHLFQEFYRAGNAKAVEESGTGLGLSIVKLLVERYGGQISVDSQESRGTTFSVVLPMAEAIVGQ
jgi:signal transduction histidine kinase